MIIILTNTSIIIHTVYERIKINAYNNKIIIIIIITIKMGTKTTLRVIIIITLKVPKKMLLLLL